MLVLNAPHTDRNGENMTQRIIVVFPTNITKDKIFGPKRDEVKTEGRKIHNNGV